MRRCGKQPSLDAAARLRGRQPTDRIESAWTLANDNQDLARRVPANDHGEAERKVLDAFWKAIFGFLLAVEARANITLLSS